MGIPDYLSAKYRELEEDRERVLGYPVPEGSIGSIGPKEAKLIAGLPELPTKYVPVSPWVPEESSLDTQVAGSHYKDMGIQPVEYIHGNSLGFLEGNVIKYVSRWKTKGGIDDLSKAKHYIEMLIELEVALIGEDTNG